MPEAVLRWEVSQAKTRENPRILRFFRHWPISQNHVAAPLVDINHGVYSFRTYFCFVSEIRESR
ncbi:hypothetical protein PSAB6_10410 [Paraburkholderia sabiae]|nr:hypothetical protein PSAB6_10410 [Paraburkholderia sabiae]